MRARKAESSRRLSLLALVASCSSRVSLDSLEASRAYAMEHELAFSVVNLVQRRAQSLFHLQRVPQVLILNDQGRVAFTRLGVVESEAALDSIVTAVRDTSSLPQ